MFCACRNATTKPAVERWGTGTELAAAWCSSLGFVAAGSFVSKEPELVPVEGVVRPALGGVNPCTDIAPTDKPKTTRRTTMPMKSWHKAHEMVYGRDTNRNAKSGKGRYG